jgi:hypothetical protein
MKNEACLLQAGMKNEKLSKVEGLKVEGQKVESQMSAS